MVSAIVAFLGSLLWPALRTAKTKVRNFGCLHNLRQWGLATALYAADNNDWLPPDGVPNPSGRSTNFGWYVQLPRQLNWPPYHALPWRTNAAIEPGPSAWICPSNPRRSNGRNLFHYCLNEHVNGTGRASRSVQLSAIRRPAVIPWLFDSKNLPAVGHWSFVHTNLHNRGAHFLFLDGHGRRLRNTDYWNFTSNRPRTNHPELVWIP